MLRPTPTKNWSDTPVINDRLLDGKEVWVFFNNTMYGSAIHDSKRLQQIIGNLYAW
jgi:hypothetical protein